jgi:2-methylaconitate cis-trans-isomerase PrpF
MRKLPAIFARGGTSNGLVFWKEHLPPESEWHKVLPAVMGSPDPYGRQLDGMGSGISSTSKICVLAPCPNKDVADVEFTFVQVGVKDGSLDMAGNCGNMSSIVGPVGFDDGPFPLGRVEEDPETGARTGVVRILNTNTSKVVVSRFPVVGDPPRYWPHGDYEMDGVPGKHSKISLSFLRPGGAKTGRTLPTGNAVDILTLPDGTTVEASLVDVSNPGVFVRLSDLGIQGSAYLDPPAVEANAGLKVRLEQIRQAGASMMGLDPRTESVPKIVVVFPPSIAQQSPGVNLKCLALSMGQAHKAVPLTLALCLGAAAGLKGTIPNQLAVGAVEGDSIVIGHPSGRLDVGTTVEGGEVLAAKLYRTARVLMRGELFY